ncbi:hypothetical protein SHELI_v1c01490 [Spiroplasma helicoides]|uniref:Uncharacterized protein n=1 Tax=Spiroplasma helicoides TaxID=216938 RepID=A0A1B3SJK1_9MOLU|nr:hypothetical protein [Spiroplasma helicoides]AOG60104.1 hypothetical protein SHELI_v1c01490 [Spiroplasma helicoides]
MSLTVQQMILNSKKLHELLKKDIDSIMKFIQELVDQCKDIDNAGFFTEKLKSLLKNSKFLLEELETKDNILLQETIDENILLENYNVAQQFAIKKRKQLADLRAELYVIKAEVVKKEQNEIMKAFENTNKSFEQVKHELINKQKNLDDKVLVKNYLEQHEASLVNKSLPEIYNLINVNVFKVDNQYELIAREMIKEVTESCGNDQDVVDEITQRAKAFINKKNENELMKNAKEFISSSSELIENELIRRENVIKIVKAIREVGYIVKEDNIRKLKEKNIIMIHGEKITGETADFAVNLDGSFIYNYEGFENHDHDADVNEFIDKLRSLGINTTEAIKKQYREPKFVANKSKLISKNKNSGK